MPPKRQGQYFQCPVCNKTFYRSPSQVLNGATRTCSKACLGVLFSGEGNPYWGQTHSMAIRQKLVESHKGKGLGNQHAKGTTYTDEQRKARSERSKRQWKEQRQKMMDSLPKGEAHYYRKSPIERRYRNHFTKRDKREWKESECRFCKSTENLTLDHIIPIFMGGTRCRENAQTLCMMCNKWKHIFIEVPMWRVLKDNQAASFKPYPL